MCCWMNCLKQTELGKFFDEVRLYLRNMKQVNMLTTLTLVVIVVASNSAHAATCSNLTSRVCEETDFTRATCNARDECECKEGFPLRTGCSGRMLYVHAEILEDRFALILVRNATAHLICRGAEDGDESYTYIWKRNNSVVSDTTGKILAIERASEENVGDFSCQLVYKGNIASFESFITPIRLFDNDSFEAPSIGHVPQAAASGASYNVTCTNFLFGLNWLITNEKNEVLTNPILVPTAKTITCSYGSIVSPPHNAPDVVSNIQTVLTNVVGSKSQSMNRYLMDSYGVGTSHTVMCTTSPLEVYMNLGDNTLQYSFTITKVGTNETVIKEGKEFVLGSSIPAVYKYFCSASYNQQAPLNSDTKTAQFLDDLIPTPVLKAQGTDLLLGSRMVLTCHGPFSEDITYSWTKDNQHIFMHSDRIIQCDNFTLEDAGEYICSARTDDYVTRSNIIIVRTTDKIAQPVIVRTDGEENFYEGEDYELECRTASATVGMTYVWKKDNMTLVTAADRVYNMKNVTASNANGTYACLAGFNGEIAESQTFIVSVEAGVPGRPCDPDYSENGCDGTGYTGVCSQVKPYRCVCAGEYKAVETECQKSKSVTFFISLMVFASVGISIGLI